jgi:hypothetical protein
MFSFFCLPDDPDGPDDLSELRLYNDSEGLMWLMKAEDWVRYEDNGKVWVGSYAIAPPTGESLPSGQYRAVMFDKGGEQSERTFGFEAPAKSRFPFPQLTVDEGRYVIKSDYPDNVFICYDARGAYFQLLTPPSKEGEVAGLRIPPTVRSIALWARDTERSVSALTNVTSIRAP